MLFDPRGPGIVAIVDWELSTIAIRGSTWRLLATWPTRFTTTAPLVRAVERLFPILGPGSTGTPIERAGHGLDSLVRGPRLFKMGVILEGTFARACAGLAPVETGDRLPRTR